MRHNYLKISLWQRLVTPLAITFVIAGCQPDQVPADDVVQSHDSGTDSGTRDVVAMDAPGATDVGIDTPAATDVHMGSDVAAMPDVPTPRDSGSGRDAGCSMPSTLHPPSADAGTRTLYCPFSGVDGGTNAYCQPGTEHCCEPTSGTASCVATATACAASDTDWQCEDPVADCPAGSLCCASGTLMLSTDPSCGNFASGFHGTHCATSCTPSEIRICTSDAECPTGQTCHPFRAKGNQVGGCM